MRVHRLAVGYADVALVVHCVVGALELGARSV